MTSATERLRALLDERGVEWDKGAFPNEAHTYWQDAVAKPWNEQCLFVMAVLTPEQAVAATLGPGTCKPVISDNLNESEGTGDAWADCSECGHLLFVLTDPNSQPPNYCPGCGKRVVA